MSVTTGNINVQAAFGYLEQNPVFAPCVSWLKQNDFSPPEGVYELNNQGLFVNVHGYQTQESGLCAWESHRHTIDFQFCIEGAERIEVSEEPVDLQKTAEYDTGKDTDLWETEPVNNVSIDLLPGDFAIFYPNERHRPKIKHPECDAIRKLVFKIPAPPYLLKNTSQRQTQNQEPGSRNNKQRSRDLKVAVASRSFSQHPVLRKELLKYFPNTKFNDEGRSLVGDVLVDFLKDCDAAITALERIDENVLVQLPKLKLISKYGVGLDMLDLPAMHGLGVRLGWTPGVNARSVAELTLSFMIDLLHRVPESVALVRAGGWKQLRGRQLTGKTVGIIGCGHVGKELAQMLKPFNCQILICDMLEYPCFNQTFNLQPSPLNRLLADSDLVTVHVPLSASTNQLIGEKEIAQMKNHAVLINAARGGVVDDAAVKKALQAGHLAGAAFDVLQDEPPTDTSLSEEPASIVTSHIGGSTEEAVLAMGRAAIMALTNACENI